LGFSSYYILGGIKNMQEQLPKFSWEERRKGVSALFVSGKLSKSIKDEFNKISSLLEMAGVEAPKRIIHIPGGLQITLANDFVFGISKQVSGSGEE